MRQDTQKMVSKKLTVTPRAWPLWKKERAAASRYEVARSTFTVWFASKQGYARYPCINVEALSCSCSTYMQMRLHFRHLVAVLHANGSTIDITADFHSVYLVKKLSRVSEEVD